MRKGMLIHDCSRDVDDAKALLHLMNKAFKPAKIQFKMIYITPTFDNELGSLRPDDTGSNKRLKEYYNGGFDSLNLYLFGAPGHYQPGLGVTSGVTNYPLLVPGEPGYGEVWTYSVFTTAFSMTDGPSGAAVIHEVGHVSAPIPRDRHGSADSLNSGSVCLIHSILISLRILPTPVSHH